MPSGDDARRAAPPRGLSAPQLLAGLLGLALLVTLALWQLELAEQRWRVGELRDDLRRLAVAQESYYYDRRIYAADLAVLHARGYRPSAGSRVVIHEATAHGWSATVADAAGRARCALFVRDAGLVGAAREPGAIACD